jgi:hypothetical protein
LANTIVLKDKLLKKVIMTLRETKVITPFANREYEAALKEDSKTVVVHEVPRLVGQRGGVAGADIPSKNTAIVPHNMTIDEVIQDKRPIPRLEQVQSKIDLDANLGRELGESIALAHEGHIAIEAAKGVFASNKINEGAPVAIVKTNAYEQMELMRVALEKQSVKGIMAAFVNSDVASKLRQSDLFDAYAEGFRKREGSFITSEIGLVGKLSNFLIYQTQDIPFKQKLTLDTIPTADDTHVITVPNIETEVDTAITFTWKAAPAAAGEIDIGASAAISQANLVAAINGGAGAGSAYIEVSAANRALLNEYEVFQADFVSNVSYTYANRVITQSETYTAETNLFGTAAQVMFTIDRNAMNFVEQMAAFEVSSTTEVGANRIELWYENVYKAATLGRNNRRITTNEIQFS